MKKSFLALVPAIVLCIGTPIQTQAAEIDTADNTVSALLTNMAQANNVLNDSLNSSGSAILKLFGIADRLVKYK